MKQIRLTHQAVKGIEAFDSGIRERINLTDCGKTRFIRKHPSNLIDGTNVKIVAGGSKWLSSKAAASEDLRPYPLWRTVRRIRSTKFVRAAEW